MVTFILIFFVAVITVGVLSVIGFSLYLKRQTRSLKNNNRKEFDDSPPPYRPLFAAVGEEGFDALATEAQMKAEAERRAIEERMRQEKIEAVGGFEQMWRTHPNRSNTIELLRLAAQSESAEVFSQTAENVIQLWHNTQAGNLTAKDLADLLDSHLRILPQQERLSGALFWVKREIENLRGKSE